MFSSVIRLLAVAWLFFFFQAEDGIRDLTVTGVQTCALPISSFQRRVWDALRAIPYGTTLSYSELARRLGDLRATRAVGAANGRNPIPIIVPCHRVVGANGALTGFGGGLDRKRWLLEHEGALTRAIFS